MLDYDIMKPTVDIFGRMYNLIPKYDEQYYLRLMFNKIPGAMSFETHRTVNGVLLRSFKETIKENSVMKDDMEWMISIHEAFASSFVPLPQIYATILAHRDPAGPEEIWELELQSFLDTSH